LAVTVCLENVNVAGIHRSWSITQRQ